MTNSSVGSNGWHWELAALFLLMFPGTIPAAQRLAICERIRLYSAPFIPTGPTLEQAVLSHYWMSMVWQSWVLVRGESWTAARPVDW